MERKAFSAALALSLLAALLAGCAEEGESAWNYSPLDLNWRESSWERSCFVNAVDCNNKIFAVAAEDGVYTSRDNGRSFVKKTNEDHSFYFVKIYGDNIVASKKNRLFFYVSNDAGETWRALGSRSEQTSLNNIAVDSNGFYACAETGEIISAKWKENSLATNGFQDCDSIDDIAGYESNGKEILLALQKGFVFKSVDHGENWTKTTAPQSKGAAALWRSAVFKKTVLVDSSNWLYSECADGSSAWSPFKSISEDTFTEGLCNPNENEPFSHVYKVEASSAFAYNGKTIVACEDRKLFAASDEIDESNGRHILYSDFDITDWF